MTTLGVKLERTPHDVAYRSSSMEGCEVTCSCGWRIVRLFAAYMHPDHGNHQIAEDMAAHRRHMELVHVQQTHRPDSCSQSCIYPRPKAPAAEVAS